MADGDRWVKIENRLTSIEGRLETLTETVGKVLAAIVGTSNNPGVGLQVRTDRLEQKALARSRLFWTMLGFSCGVVMLVIREWVRN